MTFTTRLDAPAEAITFHAHRSVCRHCDGGIVKMARNRETMQLEPDQCHCLQCGQPYYVVVPEGDLTAYDIEQWRQKAAER